MTKRPNTIGCPMSPNIAAKRSTPTPRAPPSSVAKVLFKPLPSVPPERKFKIVYYGNLRPCNCLQFLKYVFCFENKTRKTKIACLVYSFFVLKNTEKKEQEQFLENMKILFTKTVFKNNNQGNL